MKSISQCVTVSPIIATLYTQVMNSILETNIPCLESSCRITTLLVDIPGFAEAGNTHIAEAADGAMRVGTAYIFVMPYFQLKNGGDLAILRRLKEFDRGNFVVEILSESR